MKGHQEIPRITIGVILETRKDLILHVNIVKGDLIHMLNVSQKLFVGHKAVICRNKIQQHGEEAQITNQEYEDQLFVAACISGSDSSESWLIDSGCTNHMTHAKIS